jgi:diaminopropionate ammonia-lyase
VYYKDESARYGLELGSFKALGAPYAVFILARDAVRAVTGRDVTHAELRSGVYWEVTDQVTVCVATDGNQGRGLAYGARTFGCRCVIYVHRHVSEGRVAAIRNLGAIVIRVDGEYEASVARVREDARMNGWHFVSCTSWTDFDDPVPQHVMNAYMVMVEEALEQYEAQRLAGHVAAHDTGVQRPVTHVVMQGGVGSIAAAIFLGYHQRHFDHLPRFIVVEPDEADCLHRTALAGKPTPAPGSLHTIMAGLSCREVSPAAWKILNWLASDFVTIPDQLAVDGMTTLTHAADVPIVCGESAAGGTGLLLAVHADSALRHLLGLNENSHVVLFGGEGASDPDLYEELTGTTAEDVLARQRAFTLVTC